MSSNSIDQTKPLCLKTSSIAVPIFAGDSTTVTPASLRVLILSCAVPLPPDTIAAFNENLVSLQHAYVMIVKLKKEHKQINKVPTQAFFTIGRRICQDILFRLLTKNKIMIQTI